MIRKVFEPNLEEPEHFGGDLTNGSYYSLLIFAVLSALGIISNLYSVNAFKWKQYKSRIMDHQVCKFDNCLNIPWYWLQRPVYLLHALLLSNPTPHEKDPQGFLGFTKMYWLKQVITLALGHFMAVFATLTTVSAWGKHSDEVLSDSDWFHYPLIIVTLIARLIYGMSQAQPICGRIFDMVTSPDASCSFKERMYSVRRNPFTSIYNFLRLVALIVNAFIANAYLSMMGGKHLPGGVELPNELTFTTGGFNSFMICAFGAAKKSLNTHRSITHVQHHFATHPHGNLTELVNQISKIPDAIPDLETAKGVVRFIMTQKTDYDFREKLDFSDELSLSNWLKEKIAWLFVAINNCNTTPEGEAAKQHLQTEVEHLKTVWDLTQQFWGTAWSHWTSEHDRAALWTLMQTINKSTNSTMTGILNDEESQKQVTAMPRLVQWAHRKTPDAQGYYGSQTAKLGIFRDEEPKPSLPQAGNRESKIFCCC